MTRKDYVLIAEAIRETRMHVIIDANAGMDREAFFKGVKAAAEEVACKLKWDNPQFDRGRFLRACGVEG